MAISKNLVPENKSLLTAVWLLLAFFLFFGGLRQLINAVNDWRNPNKVEHTVTFAGEGKIKAAPDTARVDVGLLTEGKESIAVQNENSEKMNKVIDYLKSQGIAGEDIKTSGYNLSPKYDYVKGKSILSGYVLNQTVTVTVRDLNKVGTILDGVVTSGANQIHSVSLFVDKPEELKNKAREEAVKSAQEKAKMASRAAGFRLGRLTAFTETFGGPPLFYEALGRGGGPTPASVPPTIEPGSQEIVVSVILTYSIK